MKIPFPIPGHLLQFHNYRCYHTGYSRLTIAQAQTLHPTLTQIRGTARMPVHLIPMRLGITTTSTARPPRRTTQERAQPPRSRPAKAPDAAAASAT